MLDEANPSPSDVWRAAEIQIDVAYNSRAQALTGVLSPV